MEQRQEDSNTNNKDDSMTENFTDAYRNQCNTCADSTKTFDDTPCKECSFFSKWSND